jgi:hypothetical protein
MWDFEIFHIEIGLKYTNLYTTENFPHATRPKGKFHEFFPVLACYFTATTNSTI